MEFIITFIAGVLALLLVLLGILLIFTINALPTVLNVAVSTFTSIKITNRWYLALPLILLFSALLSWNVRIPNLIADSTNSDRWPNYEIKRKIVIAPNEKLRLKSDEEIIYYRKNSGVAEWNPLSRNKGKVIQLKMISEQPKYILRNLKIPSTDNEDSRVTLTIRTSVKNGLVNIHAELTDQDGVAATYNHVARRNFNLEDLNWRGLNEEPWRAYFSIFTQKTPWNWSRDYYPPRFSPIEKFLKKAVSFQVVGAIRSQAEPNGVPARVPKKPQSATISAPAIAIPLDEVPDYRQTCQGISQSQPFKAYAVGGKIHIDWEDQDFYPMVLGGSVDGYQRSLNVTQCSGSEIKVTSVHSGEINIWHYQVNFMTRSLIPLAWVSVPIPAELLDEELRYRAYLKWTDQGRYGVVLASHMKTRRVSSRPEPVRAHFLELEITESG